MKKNSNKGVIDYYKNLLNSCHLRLALAEQEYISSVETLFKFVFDHKTKSEVLTNRCAMLYKKMAKAYMDLKKVENILYVVRTNEIKVKDE